MEPFNAPECLIRNDDSEECCQLRPIARSTTTTAAARPSIMHQHPPPTRIRPDLTIKASRARFRENHPRKSAVRLHKTHSPHSVKSPPPRRHAISSIAKCGLPKKDRALEPLTSPSIKSHPQAQGARARLTTLKVQPSRMLYSPPQLHPSHPPPHAPCDPYVLETLLRTCQTTTPCAAQNRGPDAPPAMVIPRRIEPCSWKATPSRTAHPWFAAGFNDQT